MKFFWFLISSLRTSYHVFCASPLLFVLFLAESLLVALVGLRGVFNAEVGREVNSGDTNGSRRE